MIRRTRWHVFNLIGVSCDFDPLFYGGHSLIDNSSHICKREKNATTQFWFSEVYSFQKAYKIIKLIIKKIKIKIFKEEFYKSHHNRDKLKRIKYIIQFMHILRSFNWLVCTTWPKIDLPFHSFTKQRVIFIDVYFYYPSPRSSFAMMPLRL